MNKLLRTSFMKGEKNKPDKNWRWLQALFLVVFLSAFNLSRSNGQVVPVIDGNPIDWNRGTPSSNFNLFPVRQYTLDAFGNGVVDNQFTEGSKDFLPANQLAWSISQTKAKNDLVNGAAIINNGILYFAGDKTSNNGDAQIGFWLYLNGTGPVTINGNNIFSPPHVDGDVLVIADFTRGGRDATISVYQWDASGNGNVPNTNGNLRTANLAGAMAKTNDGKYPVPTGWTFPDASYDRNMFFEGKIDLTELGFRFPDLCHSSVLLEARSSQSITASLDDFIAGSFNITPAALVLTGDAICITDPNTGEITSTTSQLNASYQLYNGANQPVQSPKPGTGAGLTWSNLPAGNGYYVVGTGISAQCTSTSNTVNITLLGVTTATDPGDAVRCVGGASVTFTTTAGGTGPFTYQWSKDGAPIAGATSATYTVNGPITAAQAGTYTVTVTGTCGTATQDATLIVNPLPVISCSAMPTLIDITSAAHNTQLDVSLTGNAVTDPNQYTYSWTEDGAGSLNFSNIKNPVYTAGSLDAGQVISFTVTVTNKATGCVSTSNCSVTVNTAGSCPEVPTSALCSGTTNLYSAGRAPSANETWKWSVNNGASIVGADNGQSVSVKAGTQSFTLTLTISYANTELSPTVCPYEVTVNPPTTATDPSDATRCVGGASVTFTTTAGGTGPFTYQWSKDGAPIAGATSASYTVTGPITMAQAGTYSVTVTGTCGTATQSVTLTVNAATTATDPSDATRCVGGASVTFTTTAGGTGPFTYVWKKDNVVIVGATTSSYTVAGPITMAQAGTYTVEVTGACGTATQSATLTVNLPTSSAQIQTICANLLPYTWDGLVFTEAGTKTKTGLINAKGCDSTASFTLIVNATTTATDPSDATRCVGGASVTFTTTAGGTGPFTYQWSKDGAPIAGATSASYTVTGPITMAQAGTYSVTITGACGTATQIATLTVNLPTSSAQTQMICANLLPYTWDGLVFTEAGTKTKTGLINAKGCDSTASFTLIVNAVTTATDPSDETICVGGASVTFTTTAGGTGPFTYVWKKDNVVIVGATTSSYTVAGPITMAQAGTYTVEVTGTCGTATQSATLTVNAATTATDPSVATRCVGGASVTFTTTAGGTGPFTYVWKKDNVVIVGATTNSYTVAGPITMAQAGTYTVEVTGTCGTATQSATLTVNAATTATDPSDATRCVGGASVTFTTTAGGTGPFTYQWSKDGAPIAGATSASYTVNGPITMAQAGTYSVIVTGSCGTASQSATLTVNAATTATDPSDAVRCVGGASVTFTTTAGGTGPFTYQWSKDGAPIAGATSASYTVTGPITAAQAGTYSVTVTGACGTATQSATLTVNAATTATDPSDATRCVGGASVTFTTTAGGTGPFTYQWSKDGAPIAGATSASYTVNGPITMAHAGTYSVTVTGACGTATQSATLTVNPLPTVTANDASVCIGATVQLTGLPAGGTWSGANVNASGLFNAAGLTAGTYSVTYTYTNPQTGCSNSDPATVTVNAVTTATDPSDATRCVGGASVTFTTTAGGTGPFTYQWSKDGAPIAGATSASYTVNGPITMAHAGTYSVTVTGACGTASQSATLTVNAATTATDPSDATRCVGGASVTFTTTAGGTGPFTYQWSKDGAPIAGATSASYTVTGPITMAQAGTYSVTVTGTCGTATQSATLTVNAATTATDPSDATRCVGGESVVFTTTAGGTGPFTYQWSKDGAPIAGATSASYTVTGPITMAQAGTYSVTVTGACGTATQIATLTVNALPIISCSATPSAIDITSAAHNTQLDVSLAGSADTDPTHYTYSWTEDGAGSFNFSNIRNPIYTAGVLDAGQVVSFTVTVTHISTGCTSTSNCSVTVNAAGSCPTVPVSEVCNGSINSYTAGRAPSANETWKWSVNNGATIIGADNAQSVTVKAGTQNYTLTLTISYANTQLSPTVCTYDVTVTTCVPVCSYTQGFWGNKNGLELLPSLLTSPIIIGRPGQSVIIPAGSAARLNSIMPGGSTPTGLHAGDCSILDPCFDAYLTSQGRINNNLLSQTIGVALAIRLNGSMLSGMKMGSGCIITSEGTFQINQNVVTYLGANATIQDLLELANDVLGGVKMPGVAGVPGYSDLNAAMDAINNGFDECRFFVGYCESVDVTTAAVETVRVTAYPNPFVEQVNFTIVSPVAGKASLEIYNMFGQKIQTVYEGYLTSGKTQVVEFRPNVTMVAGTLIYKVTVGGKQVTGKVMNYKQ